MQHLARNSLKYHAKILGGAYREPQSYHLKLAMSTQATSEGHSPVITPATLKTTLTEKLEASYVDVEDISGKFTFIISLRLYIHTYFSHFTFSLRFFGGLMICCSLLAKAGGCGSSFQAKIVSPLFAKKTSLARHRLVNAALKTEIAAIHAWTPKCFTPEEWEKRIQAEAAVARSDGAAE